MTARAEGRWATAEDPDAKSAAALEAPRCTCDRPILDGWGMCICGREIRCEGSLSRAFRMAAYKRRLMLARGAGLHPRTGFKGLARDVGPNPELPALDAALCARVAELVAVEGDPFEGVEELMAA